MQGVDFERRGDDEYNDQHSCYIIKTVAFRSANANKFFRRLDEEMKKEYEGPRINGAYDGTRCAPTVNIQSLA
ncbi:hypothetical protein H4Q26_006951 [Puccinia striiformis f. sp. tritici PST-130]|nr:hypothetical protein H4Q26_006951 [Puccinia striiformis f. sp. tritici PST-130]